MKAKRNFPKERFIKIPSKSESLVKICSSSVSGSDADCGASSRRHKLKQRHREYPVRVSKLVSYFKIPYLRISLNPFSIAFLILVIFSNDVWPHTKSALYVSSSPIHFRHFNHRRLSSSTSNFYYNASSPSPSPAAAASLLSLSKSESYRSKLPDKLSNFVNTFPPSWPDSPAGSRTSSKHPRPNSSAVRELISEGEPNDNFSIGGPDSASAAGEMFLKPSPFLLRRFGRSSKPYRISSYRDELTRGVAAPSSAGGKFSKFSTSSMPPCSHVGDASNEILARAFIADTVFEGKVRSKSTVKDPVGKYGVTFVVQHVYKDQSNGQNLLRPKTQVRLFFVEKSAAANATKPTAHCVQRYNYLKRQGDLTKANIKRGRRYIVFVNRIGPHNYTIIGEPVPQSRKNLQAVKDVLCRNCVKQIGVWGLKNVTVDLGHELKLVCRIRGTPLPALQWFKDGAPIIVSSRLRIQYKKKRSLLVIPDVRNSDSGKYECRGLGVQSMSPVSSSSIVSIKAKFDNITALWALEGKPCPMHVVYCLNGGTCTYYETIGEFTCQCADGFSGGRCENKDAVNSNSTYESITCFDGVTPSYPCVTVH